MTKGQGIVIEHLLKEKNPIKYIKKLIQEDIEATIYINKKELLQEKLNSLEKTLKYTMVVCLQTSLDEFSSNLNSIPIYSNPGFCDAMIDEINRDYEISVSLPLKFCCMGVKEVVKQEKTKELSLYIKELSKELI